MAETSGNIRPLELLLEVRIYLGNEHQDLEIGVSKRKEVATKQQWEPKAMPISLPDLEIKRKERKFSLSLKDFLGKRKAAKFGSQVEGIFQEEADGIDGFVKHRVRFQNLWGGRRTSGEIS